MISDGYIFLEYFIIFDLSLVPHNFVWGSCFWFCIPGAPPASSRRPPVTHNTLWDTHHLSHTHNFVTHHLCQQPCHTPSFTHHLSPSLSTIFVHHHLSPSLSTTLFHTQSLSTISHTPSSNHHLCQQPSFTHHLSHNMFHTPYFTHHLSHIIFVNHLCQPPSFTHHLSPSLTHIFLTHHLSRHFAWHLVTSTFVLRGRRGTYGTGLALVARLDCIGRRWRRGTLRGRRGTWRHLPWFHVAGVALGHIHLRFAWQAWHLWHWAGSGGALGLHWSPVTPRHFAWQAWHLATSTLVLHGRRGTWSHPPSFCVAGVALMALGWLWWCAWTALVAGDAAALCVAGVALGDIHLRFTWQAWHLVTSTFVLRGRRGTYSTGLWSPVTPRHFAWQAWHLARFCMAGVALGDICLRFAWQAWHLWHWAGSGGALGLHWSPVTPRHFAWQAWHLVTSTLVSRGRRGTWSHPPSFCVAGVALRPLGCPPSLCVAGAAPCDIYLGFAWQAWHLATSAFVLCGRCGTWGTGLALVARLDCIGRRWRRGTLRGRRGAWWHPPSFRVAHVALGDIPFRFAWQAWHLWHWAGSGVTHHLCHTPSSHTTLSPTIFDTPSFTHHLSHHFVTHHFLHPTFHTPSLTHHLSHTTLSRHTPLCITPSFTHHFVTHHLSSFTHNFVAHQLCHTLPFTHNFHTHTHHLSHTTWSHATLFYFSILHHLLCLSFFPRPRYNIWCSLLEEVALWGFPVL